MLITQRLFLPKRGGLRIESDLIRLNRRAFVIDIKVKALDQSAHRSDRCAQNLVGKANEFLLAGS